MSKFYAAIIELLKIPWYPGLPLNICMNTFWFFLLTLPRSKTMATELFYMKIYAEYSIFELFNPNTLPSSFVASCW